MKTIRKNIYLYLFVIILPTILALLIFWKYLSFQEEESRITQADSVVNLQQQYIDTLIKETSKSLDILALVAMNQMEDYDAMTDLLLLTKKTDQRYGELYFLDENGVVLTGTTDKYNGIKVRDIYTANCAALKETYVSEKIEDEDHHYSYFFICNPLVNEKSEIEGYLHVQLRLDYITNVLEMLTPNVAGKITDQQQKPVLLLNKEQDHGTYDISIPFSDVPWVLHVNIEEVNHGLKINSMLNFFIFFLIFTHIVFFIIQYIIFKREAKRQKESFDNEKLHIIGTLAATTAHEIKNPLTGIKGLIQLMGEKYKQPDDEMYFSVIQKEITRINKIVNDFLFLGKPTIHQPFEIVDLLEILKDIKPILESDAATRGITITYDIPDRPYIVDCYKDQIKQVLLNITKNSFEACKTGDIVSLTISEKNKQVSIIIQDNGHGMSKNVLKNLFEPFFTTKDYGSGLGLFVCQRIIHLFKGTIDISSKQHVGTTIRIMLPLKQST